MKPQQTTTRLARSLQLQRLVGAALLGLVLGQLLTGRVHGAEEEDAADPYDIIYDVLMTRHGNDGKSYAEHESSPTIFSTSEFPFGDKTYLKFSAALDAFAALPQTRIEEYSDIKRALLQSHLWNVFDRNHYKPNHPHRRAALQPKIASLVRWPEKRSQGLVDLEWISGRLCWWLNVSQPDVKLSCVPRNLRD